MRNFQADLPLTSMRWRIHTSGKSSISPSFLASIHQTCKTVDLKLSMAATRWMSKLTKPPTAFLLNGSTLTNGPLLSWKLVSLPVRLRL